MARYHCMAFRHFVPVRFKKGRTMAYRPCNLPLYTSGASCHCTQHTLEVCLRQNVVACAGLIDSAASTSGKIFLTAVTMQGDADGEKDCGACAVRVGGDMYAEGLFPACTSPRVST